jgi:hypothetical protein
MPRPEDEYTDEPPRRRDEDDLDRPRRRRRDEDEDYPDVRRRPRGGLDAMFADTNIVLLVLFGLCCSGIALILGAVGLATCTDPKAKQNALVVTIIGGISTVLSIGIRVGLRRF